VHRIELPPTTRVFDLAFSPDGTFFAAAMFNLRSGQCVSSIWNAATYELERELKGHTNIIWSLAWAHDGKSLATASADKSIRLWSLGTKAKAKVLKGHRDTVRRVRFSPDGTTLASSSADKTIRLWSATSGELQAMHSLDEGVQAFDYFAEGARLIVGLSSPGSRRGEIQMRPA
jgi:WD40 repeat protein